MYVCELQFVHKMVDKESEHQAGNVIKIYQQKIWDSLSKNYDLIEGVRLSKSFVILMALDESNIFLTTNQIA